MKKSTIPFLRCANAKKCAGDLELHSEEISTSDEIQYGSLNCKRCKASFPILAGVAIVVPDVEGYLCHHVKGITKFVPDSKIHKKFRASFVAAKKEIVEEYQEEDLESERVNALYLMNHYLKVNGAPTEWWKSIAGSLDPLMDKLVKEHWDQGPFSVISRWFEAQKKASVVELGCGVGGLCARISNQVESYLGVDSSFHSIVLARHLNLGTPYGKSLSIPEDLLNGPVSRSLDFLKPSPTQNKMVDFVVGVIDLLPLKNNQFDISVSMNTIDMLDDPKVLPEVQHHLLKNVGHAIQCGPYIWHAKVAKRLRSQLPKTIATSDKAVEAIYKNVGFEIEESIDHIPWLFFKHIRQIELYSVHAFIATKS